MSEEPEMRHEATLAKPAAWANLANIGTQDPDVSILKCTNPAEAIAYEKNLRRLAETALNKLQEGSDAEHDNEELDTIMPQLIHDFKGAISDMYQLVRCANHKEVLKSIPDPWAECIWNPPWEGDVHQEAAPKAQILREQVAQQDPEDVMHGLDETLSDDEVRLIEKLLHSHAWMLEWQGQVSMLLGKLATSVSLKTYLALLNDSQTNAPSDAAGSCENSPDPTREPQEGEADSGYHRQSYTRSRVHEALGRGFGNIVFSGHPTLCHQENDCWQ